MKIYVVMLEEAEEWSATTYEYAYTDRAEAQKQADELNERFGRWFVRQLGLKGL